MGVPRDYKNINIKQSDYKKISDIADKKSTFDYIIANELIEIALNEYNKKAFQIHSISNKNEYFKTIAFKQDLYDNIQQIKKHNHYKLHLLMNVLISKGIELYNKNKLKD